MTHQKRTTLIAGVLLALLSTAAVTTSTLQSHVNALSAPALEGRRATRAGAVLAAQYISTQFERNGFSVQMQELPNNRRNVVARWGTVEPHIIIGAHYDGQGPGMPSASDNAAGVAVLLELARDLRSAALPVSIVAIAFDDEEQGLNGSRYYVDNPVFPLENTVAAVILDTMGRSFIDLKSWTLFVLGGEYSRELAAIVQRRGRPDMLVAGTDLIGPRSDFAAFAVKRIPYLFFTNGTHRDYHGAGDTPDRVNYTRLTQDANLIGQIVRDIAGLRTKPAYLQVPVYPPTELSVLQTIMTNVEKERADLPGAYKLIFADLKERLRTDRSRETVRVAASALLAVATPRLSEFMLTFILGPFYENAKKPEIVAAIQEESRRLQ
jgi:hypothetical protein